MSNTLVPQNNNTGVDKIEMLSTEVVDLINKFRAEEGNRKVLLHKTFMASIKNEVESLENAGIRVEQNILPYSYIGKNGKTNPCYKMSKQMVMQMCNKESALVRYKTQQYIEALEQQIEQQTQMINKQYEDRLDRLEGMVTTLIKSFSEVVEKLATTTKVIEQPKSEQISFINTPLRTPYTATKIGKQINRKPETINKVASRYGIITKTNNGWVLNKKYEEAGYGKTCKGGQYEGTFVRYSEKGKQEIIKIFNK